jgi:hypothetical protein
MARANESLKSKLEGVVREGYRFEMIIGLRPGTMPQSSNL